MLVGLPHLGGSVVAHLRTTYDVVADAAHIYLVPAIEVGQVSGGTVVDLESPMASIIGDLDRDGRLLRLELLGVSRLLPAESIGATTLAEVELVYDADADVARLSLGSSADVASTREVALTDTPASVVVALDSRDRLMGLAFPHASALLLRRTLGLADSSC